jgi:uncharacterized protein GlcG (DUF336 family)
VIEERRLGLEEAQQAIEVTFRASRDAGHRGVAVVVVDHYGEIIAGARMNGLAPRYFKAAHRKAYTAAVFERSTDELIAFWRRQEENGHRGPHDWNDPMFTTLPGGLTVRQGPMVVGGIGVSGGSGEPNTDEYFAMTALGALGPGFEHGAPHS